AGTIGECTALAAREVPDGISDALNESMCNSQVVELAFVCMQFVALSGVFTALNIPDEDFLGDALQANVPEPVLRHLARICTAGRPNPRTNIPPRLEFPITEIGAGRIKVVPARPRGTRLPFESFELALDRDRDKGVTV